MEKKKILLLLSKFSDFKSRAIGFLTGFYFTHASIGLGEDKNTFYSFVDKGFIVEKISRYVRPDKTSAPCELYEAEVSDEVYEEVKDTLSGFVKRKASLHYSLPGLLLSLLHIPRKSRRRFFCSQFVAEVLGKCRAARLKKSSSLYFPRDLRKMPEMRMIFRGNMKGMLDQFHPELAVS